MNFARCGGGIRVVRGNPQREHAAGGGGGGSSFSGRP